MGRVLRTLVALAFLVANGGLGWAQCLTGDRTPEQKACCAAMAHACDAARVNVGCCPTEAQTLERVQAAGFRSELFIPVLLTGPLALLPDPHVRVHPMAAGSFHRETLKRPDRPTHLLLSVFLI